MKPELKKTTAEKMIALFTVISKSEISKDDFIKIESVIKKFISKNWNFEVSKIALSVYINPQDGTKALVITDPHIEVATGVQVGPIPITPPNPPYPVPNRLRIRITYAARISVALFNAM